MGPSSSIVVAALYVQTGGAYFGLPGVDPWDEKRDARLYDGDAPVVAHPPCARWCQLAGLVEARYPHLKKGEDGGCFASALAAVRRCGGVLEHPAETRAFAAHGLPRPPREGWMRTLDGGWVCEVEQGHYGHRARKRTWLYAFGVRELPDLRWGPSHDGEAKVWLSWCANGGGTKELVVERMDKKERSATPAPFKEILLAMARSARVERKAA